MGRNSKEVLSQMMTDAELRDAIIDFAMADDIGLYEAYWTVPEGDIYDAQFNYGKERTWETVAEIVSDAVKSGYLEVIVISEGKMEIETENLREIIFNKDNWEPFNIGEGPGYLLREGKRSREWLP